MEKLILIDANSLVHRAFHAIPPLTSPAGEPAGALYGLSGLLLKICRDQKPDYAAAAFDRPEPTFRKEMFGGYKAQRPKTPDDLVSQIERARDIFRAFGIPSYEAAGFEADDIIGTLAECLSREGLQIVILTGDLDALQLIRDGRVVVEILKKGVSETQIYDEAAVRARYGLRPDQLPDYKGFVGDASDNIPGVKGLGPKTATRLINRFGSMEGVYTRIATDDPDAKKVLPFKNEAAFSKRLATIRRDAPIAAEEEALTFAGLDRQRLTEAFNVLGFQSLVKRLDGGAARPKADPAPRNESGRLF